MDNDREHLSFCAVPFAVTLDAEQIALGASPKFWKLIEERRRGKSIAWEDFRKRLDGPKK
jgi:hypothetical protein